MKRLLQIVSLGLVLFIAAAMAQEWGYFHAAWFGGSGTSATEAREDSEDAAIAAVRNMLAVMAHLYASGGDPRFAERMPVSQEILEEFGRDIEYLAMNGRIQESRLQKLEPIGVAFSGDDRLELATREFWIHRTFWSDRSAESDPPRSAILYARYRLVLENTGWRIVAREFDRPGAE